MHVSLSPIATRLLSALLFSLFIILSATASGREYSDGRLMPEFTERDPAAWINSEPLRMKDLRGKVILLDFWTFDCWNCYRSFPWLTQLEESLDDREFQVIGIHTPEFEHERVRQNVEEKTGEFNLTHPVMMDNDFSYWKSVNNHYWPAFYIIDKNGRLRARFIGETHAGDNRAKEIEGLIKRLLNEPVQ